MSWKCAKALEEARQLLRAQRLAKRTRAGAACLPCRAKKARCSDYRPCARCKGTTACEDSGNLQSLLSTDHLGSGVSTAAIFSYSTSQHQGKDESSFHTAPLADSTHSTKAQALLLWHHRSELEMISASWTRPRDFFIWINRH